MTKDKNNNLSKELECPETEEIEQVLGKTERINILVTPQQKKEIKAAAQRYNLTITDYLLRIHSFFNSRHKDHKK